MNEALKKIIKDIKGNVLIVGINNQYVLDSIYKNNELIEIFSLDRTKLFNKSQKNRWNNFKYL